VGWHQLASENVMSIELRFPSGITVTQAKKNAKKLAKSESIKLHEAQDRIARENGLDLPWDKAMASLSTDSENNNTKDVFSCDSITLLAIQKEATEKRKMTGESYSDALVETCRQYGLDNPELAARALFVKVHNREVHRILVGPIILTITVSGQDMYINGGIAPDKPKQSYYWQGQVVYGNVTKLSEARNGDTDRNHFPLNPGWWLCKYSIHEPIIDLSSLSFEQVVFVANFLGYGDKGNKSDWAYFHMGRNLYNSPVFESVKKWCKAHPRLASQGQSSYSGNWGDVALGNVLPA